MRNAVLDASALLAYLYDEPGASTVEEALAQGAVISTVNWAEVLATIAALGENPQAIATRLEEQGLLNQGLTILPLTELDALFVANLYVLTQETDLCFGDRSCLGLAQRLELPVLTADTAWKNLNVGVEVRLIH